jgi:hypothetical protein
VYIYSIQLLPAQWVAYTLHEEWSQLCESLYKAILQAYGVFMQF